MFCLCVLHEWRETSQSERFYLVFFCLQNTLVPVVSLLVFFRFIKCSGVFFHSYLMFVL